jgi:hypothetical protein
VSTVELREEHGRREVDVLAEIGGQGVMAFEVKADAAPGKDAALGLSATPHRRAMSGKSLT